jgi:hypothetical protein
VVLEVSDITPCTVNGFLNDFNYVLVLLEEATFELICKPIYFSEPHFNVILTVVFLCLLLSISGRGKNCNTFSGMYYYVIFYLCLTSNF